MNNENDTLKYMLNSFDKAPQIYQASLFWQNLNKKNIDQLQQEGYVNFKRTLNTNYFNFLPTITDTQLRTLVKYWVTHPTFQIFTSECKDTSLGKLPTSAEFIYKFFVSLLWEYTRQFDTEQLLEKLEEPLEGNPFKIYYKSRLISQDICNSVLEYYSIIGQISPSTEVYLNVAELGAGYGRLAYIFLKTLKCKYVIFDIPPALYVAQRYLTAVFPERKIFRFREFSNFTDIKSEYEDADVCFFTPNQLELLPNPQFNLFINISSLHEMTMLQIQNYINLINSYTRGFFYMKQWLHSSNHEDGITISYNDYPIPDTWKQVFFRKCPVQSRFFETMYEII